MNVLEVIGGVIVLAIIVGVIVNLPDVIRYLKISRM